MLIQIGSYSANVETYRNGKDWIWSANHFAMSHIHGLDIECKEFKTKELAINYAKQQLQIKYDANLARIKL